MMDSYKHDIDRIKAPDALIEKTMAEIHAAEDRRTVNRWRTASLLLAGACAVLLCIFLPMRSRTVWNTMPALFISRAQPDTAEMEEIDAETYQDLTGIDPAELIPDAAYTSGSARVAMDGSEISQDIGTFYYTYEDSTIMLCVSTTTDLAMEDIQDLDASKIAGYEVIFVQNSKESPAACLACGKKDTYWYYLYSASIDQNSFRKVVKNFLQN
jgi:hypothetical protein